MKSFLKNISIFIGLLFLLISINSKAGINAPITMHQTVLNQFGPMDKYYEQQWKKVDSLINQGLPKSALEIVDKIYSKAKKDDVSVQLIKSLIVKWQLKESIGEEPIEKIIYSCKLELDSAKQPYKQVLHSMLADLYWKYYNANRYNILNRSETINYLDADIATWDLRKIVDEVVINYQASLENPTILKNEKIEQYKDILVEGRNTEGLRPTLYDFLMHRAIDFFSSSKSGLTRPANYFELSDYAYFVDYSNFVKLKIATTDTISFHYIALKLFQDLITHNLDVANPEILVDIEIKRLNFLYESGVMDGKELLYYDALVKLESTFSKSNAAANVSYKIAEFFLNQGRKFFSTQPNSSYRYYLVKSLAKCNEIIDKYPKSNAARNTEGIKEQILNSELRLENETVSLPNLPFRALLSFKNVKEIYVRIIKSDYIKETELNNKHYDTERLQKYIKNTPIKEFTLKLPVENDYQLHQTEIKIPELPLGYNGLLVSNDKNFDNEKGTVSYQHIWISNISYQYFNCSDNTVDFFVKDRSNGQPLKGVTVNYYFQEYSYASSAYVRKKWKTFTTDEFGYFKIPNIPEKEYSRSYALEFVYNQDYLLTDYSFYSYRSYYSNEKDYQKMFFFTDRKIYRPGQTLFFKAILLHYKNDTCDIITKNPVTISLYDANYQMVSDLALTTNDYGSVNGSFTIPSTGITGQMSIRYGSDVYYFSVEEYKRPKFEVKFEPIKGTFKLNEDVKIKGIAKAYSGVPLDFAKVKFRVERNVQYTYYRWGYNPPANKVEISNGLMETNEKGEFEITFKAKPDLSYSKESNPTFTYTVYADITDINGESHSANASVRVGYTALYINLDIPELFSKDINEPFNISATNLSGTKEDAKISIVISKLNDINRVIRESYWSRPDTFCMTYDEYIKNFPEDRYFDETNIENWYVLKEVYNKNIDTKIDSVIKFDDLNKWPIGAYKAVCVSKDKYGTEVKETKYFTLYSNTGKSLPNSKAFFFNAIKQEAEPGESVSFLVGTSYKNVKIMLETIKDNRVLTREWIDLSNEQKIIEIPVIEKHRGNFGYLLSFVYNNRSYVQSQLVIVPYSNKELSFEYETFRGVLEPGQKEEWKIKISGNQKDKIAAELLAAMYDASLDAFKPNSWNFNIYSYSSIDRYLARDKYFESMTYDGIDFLLNPPSSYFSYINKSYDQLDWRGFSFGSYGYYYPGKYREGLNPSVASNGHTGSKDGKGSAKKPMASPAPGAQKKLAADADKEESNLDDFRADTVTGKADEKTVNQPGEPEVKVRTNFNETAFFFPALQTDQDGNVIISFTIPESLTKWKFMSLAHTKDLKYGFSYKEIVTKKSLMVVPNLPRFFRQGDKIYITAKISNQSDIDISGTATMVLTNPITGKSLDVETNNTNASKTFEIKKSLSGVVSWDIAIPDNIDAISVKIYAKAGNFTDGEEKTVPVLTNRMLVTETMPLPIRGKQEKTFNFQKLIDSEKSTTLKNFKYSLEFTSNPAWYAVQALPYLMEYPYECAEQTFSRFYANSIAQHIANSNPKIKAVFDSWKNYTPDALLSNLEKNQELKALMLEETPWLIQGKNESERKRNIALLFDLNKMASELERAETKLQKMQVSNGGWPWFDGMPESRYITQHIVTGFGHLDHLGIKNIRIDKKCWKMITDGVEYLDNQIRKDYEYLKKYYPKEMDKEHISYDQIQYLYARSYFMKDVEIAAKNKESFEYYKLQSQKYWLSQSIYMQGMIALANLRFGEPVVPAKIIKSLKERSIQNEEMGMYWKEMVSGYYWYQAPIETQALLIEAFDEVAQDKISVEDMKIWLLKQKQTQDWKTTKATVEACYALLLKGTDLLASDKLVDITIGNQKIDPKQLNDVKVEAGTGYFKTSWTKDEIKPEMGKIKVMKSDDGVAWGAVYWQYFEQLDKITPAETPLKLYKKLFVERLTSEGIKLEPVSNDAKLKVGDKLKVRIELRVDRTMEYVHMKDMRASSFEPINVLSSYKYQDGLGYYESTRDAATNFFFSYLQKGTYVFEYPLFVNHKGNFSNGITTIQCMYAPEFSSHSEGIRVTVE